jgi:SAM-dependent methyltransferase
MTSAGGPLIFSPARRVAIRRRMRALQGGAYAPRYLIDDMVEDVLERIDFVRLAPSRALIVGDVTSSLARTLVARGAEVIEADPADGFDEEQPLGPSGFDLIVSLGTLDTVNDLPGALIHLAHALAPGGMLLASFVGAGSLPVLRAVMLAGDGERFAPRLHPQIDARAGAQLLQRAGFADPVADSRPLDVRFGSLARLVGDLRAQGLSAAFARPGPPLGKAGLGRAQAAFASQAVDGRVTERFEIVTLTGWRR